MTKEIDLKIEAIAEDISTAEAYELLEKLIELDEIIIGKEGTVFWLKDGSVLGSKN